MPEYNFNELYKQALRNAGVELFEEELSTEDIAELKQVGTQGSYLNDEDIEKQYANFKITNLDKVSDTHGYITVEFPNATHPDFNNTTTTGYTIYSDGKIAFDDWFPGEVYDELVKYIKEN